MENPFKTDYSDEEDKKLIQEILNGSKESFEQLINRHQSYIYNIALKMVLNHEDAEDIMQEVLIIMITKLSQFQQQSKFRTWLYRIVVNYVLQMKKKTMEHQIKSFDWYEDKLSELKDEDIPVDQKMIHQESVDNAKSVCLAGMLLCLTREQRIIYILGELFQIDHNLGCEIFGISKDNFRQKLSRAKKDLYQFMDNKCGLINKSNPCRCIKKTKALIDAGWVNKDTMKFRESYKKTIYQALNEKADKAIDVLEDSYLSVFQSQPFPENKYSEKIMTMLTSNSQLKKTFNL